MSEKVLVLRVNCFQNYDFVKEHNRIVSVNGKVWFLKLGKLIPEKRLVELLNERCKLVLRTDKKHGGEFFATQFYDFYTGSPKVDMVYPEYYNDMINMLSYVKDVSNKGTWLLIGEITKIEDDSVERLVLDKTGEKISQLLDKCSSSFVYAHFE